MENKEKFFRCRPIDSQRRICLGEVISGDIDVAIYVTDFDNGYIFIVPGCDTSKYPEYAIRHADAKSRIFLPRNMIGRAECALVTERIIDGERTIVLKLGRKK